MKSEIFNNTKNLPEITGIFNLLDKKNRSLLINVSQNLKKDIGLIFKKYKFLKIETEQIEIIYDIETNLIKLLSEKIRRGNTLYNFSLKHKNLYPYLKITNEEFPRLLATRRIYDDNKAEYFGAFLPKTDARFLLGFSIATFCLRGCDISIDGSFPIPCPQFYRKKCVAPCVKILCEKQDYQERVNLLRLFLLDKKTDLNEVVLKKIQSASDELDFEKAANWRDFLLAINDFWANEKHRFDLSDSTDVWKINIIKEEVLVYLVTQRKRKSLGRNVFAFKNKNKFSAKEIMEQILWQFYQFHIPGEIFISIDFPSRQLLEEVLTKNSAEKHLLKIKVIEKSNQKKLIKQAFRRTEIEKRLDDIKPQMSFREIQKEVKNELNLKKAPQRIEAFDVAHISGTDFVGAQAVWEMGKFLPEEYKFWYLDVKNELEAMSKTIEKRFSQKSEMPDLILIDGGKSQLNSVLKTVSKTSDFGAIILSAVKPPGKHNQISHFLSAYGQSVKYKKTSEAFQILLKLRDEAHQLANYIHRTKRETRHFYDVFENLSFISDEKERYFLLHKFGSLKKLKMASLTDLIDHFGVEKGTLIFQKLQIKPRKIEPFIVPIRYDDSNGEASDLQPLFASKKI